MAQFVAALSGTIVATSVPTIMRDLDGPPSHATWLVAATILANTATTPIWGKLGDSFNPKIIVQVAIGVFVVGSIAAGLTTDTTQLIAARATQGIGLGGLFSGITVVIASLVEPRQRGKVNSWLTSVQTTATLVAPVLGGILVELPGFGWRWCFFVGVPFAVASLVTIGLTLTITRTPPKRMPADIGGAALIATGIAAVLICITLIGAGTGITPTMIGLAAYGVVALGSAVIVELRVTSPVVPLRLLGARAPLLCIAGTFLVGTAMFGGTVFISQYLQLGLGLAPSMAGLLLLPMAVGTVVSALVLGRFISRSGRVRPVLILGVSLMLLGNVCLSALALAPIPLTLVGTVLIASGLGALTPNFVLTAQNAVPATRVGAVSSSVMFFFFLGGTVGLVALGAVLNASTTAAQAAGKSLSESYQQGVPLLFAISALVMVPALAVVIALPRTTLRS